MTLTALRRAVLGYFDDSTTDALRFSKDIGVVNESCDGFCQIKKEALEELLGYLKLT